MLSNNMKTLNFGTNKNSEKRVGAWGELAGDEQLQECCHIWI